MTLWAGRVGTPLAEDSGVPAGATMPSSSRTTATRPPCTPGGSTLPGSSPTTSSPRPRRRSSGSHRGGGDDGDEDVHTAIERRLGEVGRKIHAGRSRNDQVAAASRLYVQDACAEAIESIEGFARVVLERGDGGSGHADARLHASSASAAGHARPPPARVGRDARPRSRALPLRGGAGATLAARRRRAGRLDAAAAAASRRDDAELARCRRRSRLRPRLRLRLRDALLAPLADRRGARPLGDERVRVRAAARERGDRARR